MLAWRLAWRELRGGIGGFRIFLACLILGVATIAAVGTVRVAIQAGLAREGAALLGGDAAVEYAYRYASGAERAWMAERAARVSEVVEFRSMLVVARDGARERGLTQIKAVDDLYPLVGAVVLDPPMPLAQALAGQGGRPGAVVERVLADRLALKVGDVFSLGTQEFVLRAVLARYPDNSGGGFGLGPRSIVRSADLAQSGLLGPGTLFSTQYRLELPPGTDLGALQAEAEAQFENSGMRWRDSRSGAPGITVFVDRLGAFLVLIGLSGLAVGGVGISAAVRAYMARKTPVIAALKTLGATRGVIFRTYGLQIGLLTLLGLGLGAFWGAGAVVALAPVITARLPIPAEFAFYASPLAEAALYGALTAAIFTLWPLAQAQRTKPAVLFRGSDAAGRWPEGHILLLTLALVALLVGAAAWFAQTWRLTLWTFGGIAGALLVLAGAAMVLAALARRARRLARGRPMWRAALGAVGVRGGETVSVVLSLGLGLSVLATVGQVDGALRGAISGELPEVAPSYFVVDIQPSQIEGFTARVEGDAGVSRMQAAPMLRGIISHINGEPAQEVAGEHWVLQGDRGVSYAATLPPGTTLTQGAWWPEDYSGPNLISFSADEGAELGLKLGDRLTVNILGRAIEAEIASFREVSFETAGIGFVMVMNPAALAGAPHSWISTIYAAPEAEAALIRDLSDAYPNITAIRVKDGIDRVAELLGGIAAAARYGALASLLTGALVLIGAALSGERARTYEAAVLKTLGASRRQILLSFAIRAGLTGLAAGLVALGAGALGGWAVAHYVMDTDFAVNWPNALAVVLGGAVLSLLAGLGFALRPLGARPAQVLRARD